MKTNKSEKKTQKILKITINKLQMDNGKIESNSKGKK